jgi:Flp pilus assembly protein TadD
VNDTLGWIYHKKGLSALAIAPLLESVNKDPKNAMFQYHLGMAYAGTGDKAKARQYVERALELKLPPTDAAAAMKVLPGLKG